MAWKFPNGCDVYYDNQTFLDDTDKLAFFLGGARLDSLPGVSDQYLFGIQGTNAKFSLRIVYTTGLPRFSVTVNGSYFVTRDGAVVSAGTRYTFGGNWLKDDAAGMKLFQDGNTYSASTSTQDWNWNSGGINDICIGHGTIGSSYGLCTLQNFMLWKGHNLTDAQYAALRKGFWWFQVAGLPRPAVHWMLFGQNMSRIPDLSGNGRHIPSEWIDASDVPIAQPTWAPLMDPRSYGPQRQYHHAGASGGTPPNPWDLYEEVLHPVAASLVTGLSNGTAYEFCISAVDQSGNESEKCALIEKTPTIPSAPAVTYRIPWMRPRRISKYRSAQQ